MTIELLNPKKHPLTKEQEINLKKLAEIITSAEDIYGGFFIVNSGFRTRADQLRINPHNPNSAHTTGQAVDVSDIYGDVWNFVLANLQKLGEMGLYFEDRTRTPRWVHMQIRPTRSGNIIFNP